MHFTLHSTPLTFGDPWALPWLGDINKPSQPASWEKEPGMSRAA